MQRYIVPGDTGFDLIRIPPSAPMGPPRLPAPLYSLRRESPNRPVDWRYQLAYRLNDHSPLASQWYGDDADIAQARWLLETLELTPTEEVLVEEVYDKHPDIVEAYELYFTTHANAVGMRWEVEARLLCSNETLESIAKKTGHRFATVQWYESVFFNVRDRLENHSYLFHHALGHRGRAGIDEHDIETLWKRAALSGGAHLLDVVMHTFPPVTLDDPEHARRYLDSQNRELVARQALIARLTLGTRDAPKLKLMAWNAKTVEAENKLEGHAASPDDFLLDGLQRALASITINLPELTEKG